MRREGYRRIPLRNRTGEIRNWVLIDPEDHSAMVEYRWHLIADGYVGRSEWRDGRRVEISMARQLLGLKRGDPREVDHRNRNRLDNRRSNLRVVNRAENSQNLSAKGQSRFRGVHWDVDRQKWRAQVNVEGRRVYRARFASELEAAKAADQMRRQYMPFAEADPRLAEGGDAK